MHVTFTRVVLMPTLGTYNILEYTVKNDCLPSLSDVVALDLTIRVVG